jgi:hypothetical protein
MSLLSELLDIVEHVIHTHPTWNQTMSQTEALEKLSNARAVDAVHSGMHAGPVADAPPVVPMVKAEPPAPVVADPFTPLVVPASAPVVDAPVVEVPSV